MLLIATLLISSALAGATSGALIAWLLLRRRRQEPVPLLDSARVEEIEQAAATWAKAQGRPEATHLMADKLHLLHHLGQRRGWWQ